MSGYDGLADTLVAWLSMLGSIGREAALLDGVAIAGVLLVMGFLAANRIQYRRWVLAREKQAGGPPAFGPSLDAEILRGKVREAVEAGIREAHRELERLLDGWSKPDDDNPDPFRLSPVAVAGPHGAEADAADYASAFRLAADGAGPESLESAAGLSEGEAKLVYHLQRYRTGTSA